eukprot:2622186-Alexandrium_andersonii.AAC.1
MRSSGRVVLDVVLPVWWPRRGEHSARRALRSLGSRRSWRTAPPTTRLAPSRSWGTCGCSLRGRPLLRAAPT